MNSLSRRPLRRVLLSTAATAGGVVLLLSLKPHTTARAAQPAAPVPTPSAAPSSPSSPSSPAAGSAGSAGGTSGTRTVEGDAVQTRYGTVQLRVTLSAGRITAVSVVRAPDGNPRDREIAGFAIPQLTREALVAQSANIDTVSGATYTSEGYTQSLQSALDKAGR